MNNRTKLICFPYAGGDVSVFSDWQRVLSEVAIVFPIQLPGRGRAYATPPYSSITSLIKYLFEQNSQIFDDEVVLFGHSMGALIAFEVAREMVRRRQGSVRRLIVSAHRAPQHPGRERMLHSLPDDELKATLLEMGGTSSEILQNNELMNIFLPILRADFMLCETYVSTKSNLLECPISMYAGSDDASCTGNSMLGWQYQTAGSFKLEMVKGGHFFINENAPALIRSLSRILSSGY